MTRPALILLLFATVALAQPLPPAPVIVQLPVIDYGVNGYIIQPWSVNGRTLAWQITTNWATKAVVTLGSPKSGGRVTNYVATFTLVTNRLTVLAGTNGQVFAFQLTPAQFPAWEGFELRNLETSTNLADPNGWHPVGWDTRREPERYFRVRGTNTVAATALYLTPVTFTNQP